MAVGFRDLWRAPNTRSLYCAEHRIRGDLLRSNDRTWVIGSLVGAGPCRLRFLQ